MCNYLYYWVTVRNSQSYWHLEHMGETLACTQGGAGAESGRSFDGPGRWGLVNTAGLGFRVWGACVFVCGGVRSGIFFDISRRYCIVCFCFFLYPFWFTSKRLFLFHFFSGLWRIIKNNTSCCECTSNNQTSIVLLCHNVQFIYLYIYTGKKTSNRKGSAELFSPNNTRDKEERE